MRGDFKSNNEASLVLARVDGVSAGTTAQTNSYDCHNTTGASFLVYVDTIAAGTTIDLKLQYSDDDLTFVDEPNTYEGNDLTVQITSTDGVGVYYVHCPNARARYIRLDYTTAVSTCSFSVVATSNCLLHVD